MNIKKKWNYIPPIFSFVFTFIILYGNRLSPIIPNALTLHISLVSVFPIVYLILGIISSNRGTDMFSVVLISIVYGILLFIFFKEVNITLIYTIVGISGYLVGYSSIKIWRSKRK
ncbi:MAG: hypothetical protein ACK5LC_12330 [Coprobacillaceae bacterium]